jgi:hypothetical protein
MLGLMLRDDQYARIATMPPGTARDADSPGQGQSLVRRGGGSREQDLRGVIRRLNSAFGTARTSASDAGRNAACVIRFLLS